MRKKANRETEGVGLKGLDPVQQADMMASTETNGKSLLHSALTKSLKRRFHECVGEEDEQQQQEKQVPELSPLICDVKGFLEVDDEPPKKKRRKDVSPAKYFEIIEEKMDEKTRSLSKFGCSVCGNIYKWKKSLNKHWKEKHGDDPGNLDYTPAGMSVLLAQGNHKQTGSRKCVQKKFMDRLMVKPQAVTPNETLSPHTPTAFGASSPSSTSSSPVQLTESHADEMDGDGRGGTFINFSGIPPGPFTTGTNQPAFLSLVDGLNGPIAMTHLSQTAGLLEEAVGVDTEASSDSIQTGRVSSPRQVQELEKELQAQAWLKYGRGSPAEHGSVLQCPKCDKQLDTMTAYGAHLGTHLPSGYKGLTKCAVCWEHFLEKHALNTHFQKEHFEKLAECKETPPNVSSGPSQQPPPAIKPLEQTAINPNQCPQCPFTAKWPAELQKHTVSHSENRPFHCVVCGSTYKRKWDLSKHFNSYHSTLPNPYQRSPPPAQSPDSRNGGTKDCPLYTNGDESPAQSDGRVEGTLGSCQEASSVLNNVPNFLQLTSSPECEPSGSNPQSSSQAGQRPDHKDSNPSLSVVQGSGPGRDRNREAKDRQRRKGKKSEREEPTTGKTDNEMPLFQCPHCFVKIRGVNDTCEHMNTMHKFKRYGCTGCDYRSVWKWDIHKHQRRCEGKHVNDHMFNTQVVEDEASKTQKGGVVPASRCKRAVSSRPSAESRAIRYECDKCPFTTDDFKGYVDHRSRHLETNEGDEQLRRSPVLGGDNAEVDEARLKHPRKPMKTLKCTLCEFVCLKPTTFKDHMTQVHGKNQCNMCSQRWDTKEQYLDHLIGCHPKFDPSEWESFFASSHSEDVNNNKGSDNGENGCVLTETKTGSVDVNTDAPAHSASSSPDSDSKHYEVKCQWCQVLFRNVVTLLAHSKTAHPFELLSQIEEEGNWCHAVEKRSIDYQSLVGFHSETGGTFASSAERKMSPLPKVNGELTNGTNHVDTIACSSLGQLGGAADRSPKTSKPAKSSKGERQLAWLKKRKLYLYQGIPLVPRPEGPVTYCKCMTCEYTHLEAARVAHHSRTYHPYQTVPKKYQCDYCTHGCDDIRAAVTHLKKAHNRRDGNVIVLMFEVLEPETPQTPNDRLECSQPQPPAALQPSDSTPPPDSNIRLSPSPGLSQTQPGVQQMLGTVSQSANSGDDDMAAVDLRTTPKVDSGDGGPAPAQTSHGPNSKRDLSAKEIMAAEKNGEVTGQIMDGERDGIEAGEEDMVLKCKHCSFSCSQAHELRAHWQCHTR